MAISSKAVALILVCTCVGFSYPIHAEQNTSARTLNYGVISSKPSKRIKDSYPLFSYVAKQLADSGFEGAQVHVYSSIDELASDLQSGRIDLISSTIYPALLLKNKAQAQPFLVRWKKGEASYSSVFVANNRQRYNDLSELQGKIIGFEDRNSTSGYFLPMVTLLNQGLEVQHITSAQQQPNSDKIGYFFFDDRLRETNEVNMSMWAAMGKVDAIAYSSSNWTNPKDTPAALKQHLHMFAQTGHYPRSIISVSSKLDPAVAEKLRSVLLHLDQSDMGKKVLQSYQETKRFSVIDSNAEKLLDEAEQLLNQFEDQK